MSEHTHEDPEKIHSATTTGLLHPDSEHTDLGKQEYTPTKRAKKRPRFGREFKFWSFLIAYSICCIALSVILATVINNFNAVESTTPRYVDGKLQLRVADITTLISAGLVVIKLLVTSWTFVAV
ncbi:hypothetical protein MMC10_002315 [Thelotrema lepadinum]|nr:hypothetical protein [Thelotrema lepadinum]